MDEFLIIAEKQGELEWWTRSKLGVSKFIADQAIVKLGYHQAKVYNIFGGHCSDELYIIQALQSKRS